MARRGVSGLAQNACIGKRAAIFLATAVFLTGRIQAAELQSPRIQRLAAAVAAGDATTVDAFWAEVAKHGTPLVESIQGQADQVWLTFVWRGDDTTQNVVLAGGAAPGDPVDNLLERLPGTNVWYRSRPTRADLRTTYFFSPNDSLQRLDWSNSPAIQARAQRLMPDPLNPRRDFSGSIVELPGARPQPWIQARPQVPRGTLHAENLRSAILDNERRVTVYRPPGYRAEGIEYPLLIVFDLEAYTLQVPTPTILNNLIAEKKIPPVVAALVGNVAGARNSELSCNDSFVRFLHEELLPWVAERHRVTSDPRKTVVAGSSAGGLMALYFAFRHPERVGNVLAQSPSIGWGPQGDTSWQQPEVEDEWLTRQFVTAPRSDTRFFIETGLLESVRVPARHLRDVLLAKGYPTVVYSEYHGAHDYLNWRGSLADGLELLLNPPADHTAGP